MARMQAKFILALAGLLLSGVALCGLWAVAQPERGARATVPDIGLAASGGLAPGDGDGA